MNCQSVRELLSAFYDRELTADQSSEVRAHVDGCPECARRLAEFEELSHLTAHLRDPQAPEGGWPAIASALDHEAGRGGDAGVTGRLSRPIAAALAATLLVAASIGLATYWARPASAPHAAMAATFDVYLKEFRTSPAQAQRVLIDRYHGQRFDLAQGATGLPFEPNAPEALPDGFERQDCFVLKMPCCTCTQTIYKNKAGAVVVLFEHAEAQQDWFGGRPTIEAVCHGNATHLVQLPDQLAATWKCGQRYLTVIGAQNVEQVAELVALLDGRT
jgi:hypothetical protein